VVGAADGGSGGDDAGDNGADDGGSDDMGAGVAAAVCGVAAVVPTDKIEALSEVVVGAAAEGDAAIVAAL